MLVLDDTYISPEVFAFAESTQEPIFDNASARRYASEGKKLNIVDNSQATNERIIAFSEAHCIIFPFQSAMHIRKYRKK